MSVRWEGTLAATILVLLVGVIAKYGPVMDADRTASLVTEKNLQQLHAGQPVAITLLTMRQCERFRSYVRINERTLRITVAWGDMKDSYHLFGDGDGIKLARCTPQEVKELDEYEETARQLKEDDISAGEYLTFFRGLTPGDLFTISYGVKSYCQRFARVEADGETPYFTVTTIGWDKKESVTLYTGAEETPVAGCKKGETPL